MKEYPENIIPFDLINLLRRCEKHTVLTGAGISAESSIPTFREAQTSLWAQYDPHELATSQAFRRNPRLVWEWYTWRRELISKAKPNPAHKAISMMENVVCEFTLITQNVDGLHHAAGSRNIIELHGNIYRTKCFDENVVIDYWKETDEIPPRCPQCGSYLRPDVVWFGEQLNQTILKKAISAANNSNIFFSIGTSGVVEPAATLPYIAKEAGAVLVEINPHKTTLSNEVDFLLRGYAGSIVPMLVKQTWNLDD